MSTSFVIADRNNPERSTMFIRTSAEDALYLTFDEDEARRFPSSAAANRFAADRIAGDVYVRVARG